PNIAQRQLHTARPEFLGHDIKRLLGELFRAPNVRPISGTHSQAKLPRIDRRENTAADKFPPDEEYEGAYQKIASHEQPSATNGPRHHPLISFPDAIKNGRFSKSSRTILICFALQQPHAHHGYKSA